MWVWSLAVVCAIDFAEKMQVGVGERERETVENGK